MCMFGGGQGGSGVGGAGQSRGQRDDETHPDAQNKSDDDWKRHPDANPGLAHRQDSSFGTR